MLRDLGFDALEVRTVLAQDAPDDAVVAYALAQGLILITHDRGCARRAAASGVRHVRLRTRETQDRERLRASIDEVLTAFDGGAVRVTVFLNVLQVATEF